MVEPAVRSIAHYFQDLDDPRLERSKCHELADVIVIALCAVICGADTWVAVEKFGHAKIAWLRQRLALANGIPSHDTFRRVFRLLDPDRFMACFLAWVGAVADASDGRLIPIDGKTARRSVDSSIGQSPLHLVSAWAEANHLLLGQVAVDQKSNEITAIPALLALLDLHGAIVTIDAMGCQKEIAAQIVAGGGDYVLAVKGNQDTLHTALIDYLGQVIDEAADDVAVSQYDRTETGHGRTEERLVLAVAVPDDLPQKESWAGLASLCLVVRTRQSNGKVEGPEAFYYISSLPADAQVLAAAIRGHWSIENNLHWVLDMSFREDESRVRKDNAPANFGLLRRIALSLLKCCAKVKGGIQTKRLQAGWDDKALEAILEGF